MSVTFKLGRVSTLMMKIKMMQVLISGIFFASNICRMIMAWEMTSSNEIFQFHSGYDIGDNVFDKGFHTCSIDNNCKFVVKNVITNMTTMYTHEEELPNNLTDYAVFEKKKKTGKII